MMYGKWLINLKFNYNIISYETFKIFEIKLKYEITN